MDSKPPELDKIGPPPEQEQLRNIMDLAHSLTEGVKEITEVWRDKGWLLEEGDIDVISVSRLTEDGEKQYPDYPLAMIRIFRKKPEGRTEQKYHVSKDNGKLRIDRYDSVRTPEEEQEKYEWKKKLGTLTHGQADEALNKIMARLEQRQKDHEFERQIGHSYVDREEAQEVIEQLSKLQAQ